MSQLTEKTESNQGGSMKPSLKCILAALLALFGFALFSASVYAEEEGKTFVYTDNNPGGPNSVSGFSVLPGGTLMPVPGSPYLTGGTGSGDGYFASHRINATVLRRNLL